MSNLFGDKKSRLGLVWVSLFAALSLVLLPSDASAGPLLDWLFQRNRTSAYYNGGGYSGSPYAAGYRGTGAYQGNNAYGSASGYGSTSGYGANYAGNLSGNYDPNLAATGQYGQNGLGQNGFGQNAAGGIFRGQNSTLFPKCCLFGRGRGLAANTNPSTNPANGLAGAGVDPRTTAGYGSCETGCQPGWCQQTVLRYVPYLAYRTAYQPVPVTTYKTSTSINPSNGLPRTCTRPCTSYSYQARRVPYTTYRPVYTTVPVADDCGCNQNATPQQAGYAPYAGQNYAGPAPQRSGYGGGPACTSCQNGGWNTPGYTPGDATFLPPAPSEQVGPWRPSTQSGFGDGNFAGGGFGASGSFGDVPGATPWRPLRGDYADSSNTANSYADIPWQPVPQNGVGGGVEADRRPTLRPDTSGYDGDYGYYDDQPQPSRSGSSTRLRAVPSAGEFESQPNTQYKYDPSRRIDGARVDNRSYADRTNDFNDSTSYGAPSFDNRGSEYRGFAPPRSQDYGSQDYGSRSSPDYFDNQPIDRRLFTTPRQMSGSAGYSNPMEVNETRRSSTDAYRSRAIRDLDRERKPYSTDDKTARDASPETYERPSGDFVQSKTRGTRPVLEEEANTLRSSRFAAMPIDWSAVSRTREVATPAASSDWQVR